MSGTLDLDVCRFITISCRILFRMKNDSDRICRENQNPHLTLNNFFSANHTVYEIMYKNTVQPDRPQMTM